MKDKLDQIKHTIADSQLIEESRYQLVPIEALQNTACQAGVVNLFYQQDAANESEVDFDSAVDEAWNIVEQQASIKTPVKH